MPKKRKMELPLKVFSVGDTIEVQDAADRAVIKWTGFDGSDFDLTTQRRMARLLAKAANAKA